jgi:hypothetical protein
MLCATLIVLMSTNKAEERKARLRLNDEEHKRTSIASHAQMHVHGGHSHSLHGHTTSGSASASASGHANEDARPTTTTPVSSSMLLAASTTVDDSKNVELVNVTVGSNGSTAHAQRQTNNKLMVYSLVVK